MFKEVRFAPKGIVVIVSDAVSKSLQDTLFAPLSQEQIAKVKAMDEFSLTRKNYGNRAMIIGNQSQYVEIEEIRSYLHKEWNTQEVFSRYREHNFDRGNPEHEFLELN